VAALNGNKICFALANPQSIQSEPLVQRRGKPYLMISTRPAQNVFNEPSIQSDYSFNSNAEGTAQLGSESFAFVHPEPGRLD
jgi:hypothetical protein